MRLFVSDTPEGDWDELTGGGGQTVRVAAADLQQAQRARARIRADVQNPDDLAVILDVTVAVASDFRVAYRSASSTLRAVAGTPNTVHYAGTVDGLTGLIADIESADVADGVTLIPATPQDVRALGRDVLRLLAQRSEPKAS